LEQVDEQQVHVTPEHVENKEHGQSDREPEYAVQQAEATGHDGVKHKVQEAVHDEEYGPWEQQ